MRNKAKLAKAASPPDAKASIKTKSNAKKPRTAQAHIQRCVLQNPKISVDEILEKMERSGYTPTRWFVATCRSNFRNAIRLIQSENVDVRDVDI